MKDLTVKQLAVVSGVTVRTLHHYDEIGLLSPAHVGANGYRYYGRKELLRLQQILFHRELGVPLGEISELLEMEQGDQVGVLLRQRERLVAERERFQQLIQTIDLTVASLKDENTMTNADLYKGFAPEKQAEYEAWLIEKYGDRIRANVEHSRKAFAKMTEAEREATMQELASLEQGLAEGLRRGVAPESTVLDHLLERHRLWVGQMWDRPCTREAYGGLADIYLAHPDFRARYESVEPGFTDYLTAAMRAYAAREEGALPR
jgi:MerR family transcriptional regulator, thiopeptide resistance regulator